MFNPKLLFANDDVLTQWIMVEVLRGAGFAVTSVCRGIELAELLDDIPDFDVLVADLDLPCGGPGVDIGACWQRALPDRPLIYTGTSRSALHQPLQLHERFLPAPFSASLLLQTIDRALDDVPFHQTGAATSRRLHLVH